jgi:quinoprotein glucose dehydrogenase
MVGGVLYFSAGVRRDVVAVNAATGETLWLYRYDEGERGAKAVRFNNRGIAYWTNGQGDERILVISPGYHLIERNAKTGLPIPEFGASGIVDLWTGLDRDNIKPGVIGATSTAIVVRDVVIAGAALGVGRRPRRVFPGTCAVMTCTPENCCGPSTPSRWRENSATTRGRTVPGSTPATLLCGRR